MQPIKIVADSSANILDMAGVDFAVAPLKILTDDREFTDDRALPLEDMITYFERYKGRSQTSCPNVTDWLETFGDAEEILCVTITGALSGSYNAACSAKRIYEEEHPGRRVFVLDSLTAGPEIGLMIDQLAARIAAGDRFDSICEAIEAYRQETGLMFMLKSLHNFARNGRVSPSLAKIAGLAGICVVGKASDAGTLEPTDKCRGEARSLAKLVDRLGEAGLHRGRVCIAHCQNESGAETLQALILQRYPAAQVDIRACRGLCSYYVEKGGILVGFEKI